MKIFKNILIALLLVVLLGVGFYTYQMNQDYETLKKSVLESEVTHHTYVNDNQVSDDSIMIIEDVPWINYKVVKEYVDDDIWLSGSGNRVYIPLETLDVNFANEEINYYIKSNLDAFNIPLYGVGEEKYIDLDILVKLYDLEYMQMGETKILMVDGYKTANLPLGTEVQTVIYKGDQPLIVLNKFTLDQEEQVVLLTEGEYTKVIFKDGRQGSILASDLIDIDAVVVNRQDLTLEKQVETPEKISLIWDDLANREEAFEFYHEEKIDGLNVISPIWFSLNVEGIVINSADVNYSRAAHDKGYQVWGLYKNSFDPDWTNELLNNDQYVKKSIAQLLFYASLYELDGINIDFENVYYKDKDLLTAYVKEFYTVLKNSDLLLSIDVTRPGGSERYSKVIDREAMNDYMDYFVLMAYDEHWGSSPIAGSVASIPWTEKSIELSLEVIDRDKLILGMPLYTRLWKTSNGKVSSKAYAISYIDQVLEGKYFDYNYDESSGQNYLTYNEDGATYQLWAEDKVSLQKRIDMAENFQIPGLAMWRKGYETPYVWDMLRKYLE